MLPQSLIDAEQVEQHGVVCAQVFQYRNELVPFHPQGGGIVRRGLESKRLGTETGVQAVHGCRVVCSHLRLLHLTSLSLF